MKKRIVTKMLVALLLSGTLFCGDADSVEAKNHSSVETIFSDVYENKWYLEYIQYVFDNGLMKGNGGRFRPLDNITKAQVAQVLYNMSGETNYNNADACTELRDVEWDVWYTKPVCWAYDHGIISGNPNSKKFYPNSEVTREQLAAMFYRYAKYKKLDTTQTTDISGFINAENVGKWSETAVKWAVEVGLISGSAIYENGEIIGYDLAPQGSATRAQMAAILKRFFEEPKVQQPAKPGTEDEDDFTEEINPGEQEGRWLYEANADNTITILDYDGGYLRGDLIVPSTIHGRTVSALGEEAVANMGINSVTIPKEIKTIGKRAFAECRSLKTITIGEGAVEVAGDAFEGCYNLANGGIEKIVFVTDVSGASAWIKSGALQNLKVKYLYPSNDTSWTKEVQEKFGTQGSWIAYESFVDDAGINWIYQKKENQTVSLLGYLGVLGTKAIEIPEELSGLKVVEIPDRTFIDSYDIESVVIPTTVTKIGEAAFGDCGKLKNVRILGNVGEIANRLFAECWSLETIELPDGITAIGDYAFGSCQSLKSVVIPDSVIRIGDSAFHDCLKMESLKLSKNLQEVGENAFRINPCLKEIVIPGTLTEIPENAFFGCSSLTYVQISEGVEIIGERAFEACRGMNKLVIADTVKTIMARAFSNNTRLDSIIFYGDSPEIMGNAFENVTGTAYYSFSNKGWTENIFQNYGGSLTWTNYSTAEESEGPAWLYRLNEDKSIAVIGHMSEEPLTKLIIPTEIARRSVTTIAPAAFAGVVSLTDVTIPAQVTNIEKRAFLGCENLKNVNIHSSLDVLQEEVFAGCTSLKEFSIPETVTTLEKGVFDQCSGLETIVIPSSVSVIGEDAFYRCENLKNVEIGNGTTIIGSSAFAFCEKLEGIILPEKLLELGKGLFAGCENLTQVILPKNIEVLSDELFRECISLKNVVIPETVEAIGAGTFERCYGLEKITIPQNVKKLGKGAFKMCENLQEIIFEGSAPEVEFDFEEKVFGGVKANVYYPANDETWNDKAFESFDNVSLIWIGVTEK